HFPAVVVDGSASAYARRVVLREARVHDAELPEDVVVDGGAVTGLVVGYEQVHDLQCSQVVDGAAARAAAHACEDEVAQLGVDAVLDADEAGRPWGGAQRDERRARLVDGAGDVAAGLQVEARREFDGGWRREGNGVEADDDEARGPAARQE